MRLGLNTFTLTLVALALALAAAVAIERPRSAGREPGLPATARLESYGRGVAAGPASRVVTFSEIAAAGRGTAGQALLRWWRLLQLDAPPSRIAAGFAPTAGVRTPRLARQLRQLAYQFDETRPTLVDGRVKGGVAQVAVILSRIPAGGDAADETEAFEVFRFVRVRGAWKLQDNAYLDKRYAAERAYLARHGDDAPRKRRRRGRRG